MISPNESEEIPDITRGFVSVALAGTKGRRDRAVKIATAL